MKSIILLELREMIRNKWWVVYGFSFLLLSSLIFHAGITEPLRASASLLNLVLLLVPLFSLIFGSVSWIENASFQEILLTIPTTKAIIFFGKWLGLSIGLSSSFVLGLGLSSILFSININFLILLGVILTFIFVSLSFLLANILKKKELIFGAVLFLWIFFFILYDVFIMEMVAWFSDYPLEILVISLVFGNPIDMARVMMTIREDLSAMMGYSGALFAKYFGSGILTLFWCMLILSFWIIIPLFLGYKRFCKKDL